MTKTPKKGKKHEKEPFYEFICGFCSTKLRNMPPNGICKACGWEMPETDEEEE